MEREALGQRARFERFAASMLYVIAAGKNIDMDKQRGFDAQMDEIYCNPFKVPKKQPMTAEEIKQHLINRIDEYLNELNGG